jgi:hypothetical protein
MLFANSLDGTENVQWHSSGFDGPDLSRDIDESADWKCEMGCTNDYLFYVKY